MRIGFFGGSFDPPHRGHLAVAKAAAEAFALEQVLLAPAGLQPLKPAGTIATFAYRLAMVELLVAGVAGMQASSADAPRSGPNYTIDTVRRLKESAAGAEVFVVVGADAFLQLKLWREPEALLSEAEWIVVSRPGFPLAAMDSLALTADQRERVHLFRGVAEPASATEIRERLGAGDACKDWLPVEVLAYIRERHLYGT